MNEGEVVGFALTILEVGSERILVPIGKPES